MLKSLPANLDFDQLRRQAKDLLKAHRQGDAETCRVLALHHRFVGKPDQKILAAKVTLQEMQHALALSFGFKSWQAVRAHLERGKARGAAAKVDYANVNLECAHDRDHFSVAIHGAARLLGVDVDYNTVVGLSTNCFSPAMQARESCKSWWMACYGRDICLPFVAKSLGLAARPVTIAAGGLPEPEGEARVDRERAQWADLIREAHQDGEVVVLWRTWATETDHGWHPWAWFGIVTRVDSGGNAFGACWNELADNPIDVTWKAGVYALKKTDGVAVDDRAALGLIRARILGEGDPFATPNEIYGLEAIEKWASAFENVPFCPVCKEMSWHCTRCSLASAVGGAREAATYLRRTAEGLGGSRNVEKAADCYDRIAAIHDRYIGTDPFVNGGSCPEYEAMTGNLELQLEHASEIRRIGSLLREAAEHIGRAQDSQS